MKKKIFLAAICMVLISASMCLADQTYLVTNGPAGQQDDGGGVFAVTPTGGSTFYTYCLETGEFITLGNTYPGTLSATYVYYGTSEGNAIGTNFTGVYGSAGQPLLTTTQNLYAYYLDHIGTLTNLQKQEIQDAIWYLQGQISLSAYNSDYSSNPYDNGTYTGASWHVIEALNLWTINGTHTTADTAQSLLIDVGTPVPEPSLLILLGLGLVGLAGLKRKF
ncbi:MAG: PEP-CTERM sorting domain-containing protein [Syntrophales bacterium]